MKMELPVKVSEKKSGGKWVGGEACMWAQSWGYACVCASALCACVSCRLRSALLRYCSSRPQGSQEPSRVKVELTIYVYIWTRACVCARACVCFACLCAYTWPGTHTRTCTHARATKCTHRNRAFAPAHTQNSCQQVTHTHTHTIPVIHAGKPLLQLFPRELPVCAEFERQAKRSVAGGVSAKHTHKWG